MGSGVPRPGGLDPPPPAECECAGESVRRTCQDMCRLSACFCIFLPGPLLMLWITFQPQGSSVPYLASFPSFLPITQCQEPEAD